MKQTAYILLLLCCISCSSTKKLNVGLKNKLDAISYKDQTLRALFNNPTAERKAAILNEFGISEQEFETKSWNIVSEQDSINIGEIEKIIRQYGYPGKTLVGEPANKSAWYVIQHSTKIETYFPLIKAAGAKKEIPNTLVAMMEDRLLMYRGVEQIYGTQVMGSNYKNPTTGKTEWINYVWPIKDINTVNERRKKIGFTDTVEQSAEGMGVTYKIYTLAEAKEMKKNK